MKFSLLPTTYSVLSYGAPVRIRTSDLLIRSQLLYPAELQAHPVQYTVDGNQKVMKKITVRFRLLTAYYKDYQ
jgi:hypothetical protein